MCHYVFHRKISYGCLFHFSFIFSCFFHNRQFYTRNFMHITGVLGFSMYWFSKVTSSASKLDFPESATINSAASQKFLLWFFCMKVWKLKMFFQDIYNAKDETILASFLAQRRAAGLKFLVRVSVTFAFFTLRKYSSRHFSESWML